MIVQIDNQPWSQEDLTGGGSWVEDSNGVFTLLTPVRDNGTIGVLQSIDHGKTWSETDTLILTSGSVYSDPQVVVVGTTLWFVTPRSNSNSTFTLFLGSVNLSTGKIIPGTLDIVTASGVKNEYSLTSRGGDLICVVSLFQPQGFSFGSGVVLFRISGGLVVDTKVVDSSPFRSDTETVYTFACNGVSTSTTDTQLYWLKYPRKYQFKARVSEIWTRSYNGTSLSEASRVLQYSSEFNDDKFTVISDPSGTQFLAHSWYAQAYAPGATTMVTKRTAHITLGRKSVGGVWAWQTLDDSNPIEPTLSLSDRGAVITYLSSDMINPGGLLRVFDWSPSGSLTERSLRTRTRRFVHLLGSKSFPDAISKWVVIGVSSTDQGNFPFLVSEFNLPPVPVLAGPEQVRRGVWALFDASGTTDPDLDTMTFVWSISPPNSNVQILPDTTNPAKASVWVSKSIGPNPQTFQVSVSVQDWDDQGSPINSPVTISKSFSVPVNLPPTVQWTQDQINSLRAPSLTLSPVVSDPEGDELVYTWSQTSGPIVPMSGATTKFCTLDLSQLGLGSSKLGFSLSVSDLISPPVTSAISVIIPALNPSPLLNDQGLVCSSVRLNSSGLVAGIGTQGSDLKFQTPVQTGNYSNINHIHSVVDSKGQHSFVLVSDRSVLILSDTLTRKVYLPKQKLILGGTLTENGEIWVLGRHALFVYSSTVQFSDAPIRTLDLSSFLSGKKVNRVVVTPAVQGSRAVLVLSDQGLLCLQVSTLDTTLVDQTLLSSRNGLLSGSNNVVWVRYSGLESLTKGLILVGTRDDSGVTYETLIDMSKRRIKGSWDASNRINPETSTGEILFDSESAYLGAPSAPTLLPSSVVSSGVRLLWTQDRPDLVSGYEIQSLVNSQPWTLETTIPSGAIREFIYTGYSSSNDYSFRVRSYNQEGKSVWSNVISLSPTGSVCSSSQRLLGKGSAFSLPGTVRSLDKTTIRAPRIVLSADTWSVTGTKSVVSLPSLAYGQMLAGGKNAYGSWLPGEFTRADNTIVLSAPSVLYLDLPSSAYLLISINGGDPVQIQGGSNGLVPISHILPPGAYSVSVAPISPTYAYLGALVSVPSITQSFLYNGISWWEQDDPAVVTSSGSTSPRPSYFPESVSSSTGSGTWFSGGSGILWFSYTLDVDTTIEIIYQTQEQSSLVDLSAYQVFVDDNILTTVGFEAPDSGTPRRSAQVTLPSGAHTVKIIEASGAD